MIIASAKTLIQAGLDVKGAADFRNEVYPAKALIPKAQGRKEKKKGLNSIEEITGTCYTERNLWHICRIRAHTEKIYPAKALRRKEKKKVLNSIEETTGKCYKDWIIIVRRSERSHDIRVL